jgi:hypothetical protein
MITILKYADRIFHSEDERGFGRREKKIFESKLKRRELLILEYDNLPLCIKYRFEVLVWLLQAV